MGVLSAFVGFASSFAVVLQGLAAVGATPAQSASGLMALSLAMGLCGILLSAGSRLPVSVAWSTPGSALLVTTGAVEGGFAGAVGAFSCLWWADRDRRNVEATGEGRIKYSGATGERDACGDFGRVVLCAVQGGRGISGARRGDPRHLDRRGSMEAIMGSARRARCVRAGSDIRARRAGWRAGGARWGFDANGRGRDASVFAGNNHRGRLAAVRCDDGITEYSGHRSPQRQWLSVVARQMVSRNRHREHTVRAVRWSRGKSGGDYGSAVRGRGCP